MNTEPAHGLPLKITRGIALNLVVSVAIVASLHLFFYLFG